MPVRHSYWTEESICMKQPCLCLLFSNVQTKVQRPQTHICYESGSPKDSQRHIKNVHLNSVPPSEDNSVCKSNTVHRDSPVACHKAKKGWRDATSGGVPQQSTATDATAMCTEIKLIQTNITSVKILSLRFNDHFPGKPGLAGVLWSKGWWKWWWQLEL